MVLDGPPPSLGSIHHEAHPSTGLRAGSRLEGFGYFLFLNFVVFASFVVN